MNFYLHLSLCDLILHLASTSPLVPLLCLTQCCVNVFCKTFKKTYMVKDADFASTTVCVCETEIKSERHIRWEKTTAGVRKSWHEQLCMQMCEYFWVHICCMYLDRKVYVSMRVCVKWLVHPPAFQIEVLSVTWSKNKKGRWEIV